MSCCGVKFGGQTDLGCVTCEPAVDQLVDHRPRARPADSSYMSHRQTPCQGTNGHLLPSRIGYVADRGGLRNSCIAAVRHSSPSVPSGRVMTIAVLAGPSTWLMVSARMATRCGRTSPSGAVAFWTRCPASSNAGSRPGAWRWCAGGRRAGPGKAGRRALEAGIAACLPGAAWMTPE